MAAKPRASRSLPVEIAADIFSGLGDPTRLKLMRRLGELGPLSIKELSEGLESSRQAITKHLRVMEDCGLVTSEKAGREQIFALDQYRLDIAQNYLEWTSDKWDVAIGRIKKSVED